MTTILVATAEGYREHVSKLCSKHSLVAMIINHPQEITYIVKTVSLRGIILDSDWLRTTHIQHSLIIKDLQEKGIPYVALIRKVYPLFDALYQPPLHQVLTIPFHIDELEAFMWRAGMITEQK